MRFDVRVGYFIIVGFFLVFSGCGETADTTPVDIGAPSNNAVSNNTPGTPSEQPGDDEPPPDQPNDPPEPELPKLSANGWHCDPALELDTERYNHLVDVEGEDLSRALATMVQGHYGMGYGDARTYMFTDMDVLDDGTLECIYTGRRVYPDGTRTPDGFNTEHTWPQSRGASSEPARSDMHHLFTCDEDANTERGSLEFGWVSCQEHTCPWARGGSLRGPGLDGREMVFEVRPERRGDVARAILYFSIRYNQAISELEEATLRDWHCEDPPDEHERRRNDRIAHYQQKRNPFVDRPDFVDLINAF